MALAYLGIGTNLGDKKKNIENCISLIKEEIGRIKSVSSIYETEPWGVKNQDNYFNLVIEAETQLQPLSLLQKTQYIEHELGRRRKEKWESRIIDIDILLFEDYNFFMDNLIIPHPYIAERNFVLEPLCEINPNLMHPKLRMSINKLLTQCEDTGRIKRLEK